MSRFDKAKKVLSGLASKLDKNPVYLGGNSYYTSGLGAVCGLVILIVLVFYTYSKFYSSYYSYTNLIVDKKSYENDPTDLNISKWRIRLFVQTSGESEQLNPQNMYQLGLNITANNFNNQLHVFPANISQLLFNSELGYFYADQLLTPAFLKGSYKDYQVHSFSEFGLRIERCYPSLSQKCNTSKVHKLQFHITFWPQVLNPYSYYYDTEYEFNQFSYSKIGNYYTNQTKAAQYNFYISSENCTSDLSILPSLVPVKRDSTFRQSAVLDSDEATSLDLTQFNDNVIAQFVFKRTRTSTVYSRKSHTLDELFASILGMSAVFTLVVVVLCSNYNHWASEEMIISQTTGKKRKQNFKSYVLSVFKGSTRTVYEQKVIKFTKRNCIDIYKDHVSQQLKIKVLQERMAQVEKLLKISQNEQIITNRVTRRFEDQKQREERQLYEEEVQKQKHENLVESLILSDRDQA